MCSLYLLRVFKHVQRVPTHTCVSPSGSQSQTISQDRLPLLVCGASGGKLGPVSNLPACASSSQIPRGGKESGPQCHCALTQLTLTFCWERHLHSLRIASSPACKTLRTARVSGLASCFLGEWGWSLG